MSTECFYTKIDEVRHGLSYIGQARYHGIADTNPLWRISRIIRTGTVTTEEVALGGSYAAKWSDRVTYFSSPSFDNAASVQFDGANDFISCTPGTFGFERTDKFSVSVWVRPAGLSGSQTFVGNRATGSAKGWELRADTSAPRRVRLAITNTAANSISVETTNDVLSVSAWTHILATYDGSSLASGVAIYINGVAASTTVITNALTNTILQATNLTLGAAQQGNSNLYLGFMDEVSVWGVQLTAGDAASLYNSGKPGDLTQLVKYTFCMGWWRMGDSSAYPLIKDERGYADGVMVNMTSGSLTSIVP